MTDNKKKHIILIISSILFLAATLYVPQKADVAKRNGYVSFGYPFSFITQNFSEYDPVNYYQRFGFREDAPIESFSVGNAILSLFSVFVILEILVLILETVDFKIRQWMFKSEEDVIGDMEESDG